MKTVSSPTVSVLIVNFNSGPWVSRCVESVLQSPQATQIIVGDNGSRDDSIDQLERTLAGYADAARCTIHRFGTNLGFATAVNRLIVCAKTDYLLLLNPDCLLPVATLPTVINTLAAEPNAGMAGCLIRNPDGSEQRGCRRRIPTLQSAFVRAFPRLARYLGMNTTALNFDLTETPLPEKAIPVEAISGAFMLVSKSALQHVGPMDEGYFLHCEDLDWCLRFTRAGYRILFVPGAEIIHKQGTCSAARPIRVEWHKHYGMLRFFRKFHERQQVWMLPLVTLAVLARFLLIAAHRMLGRRPSGDTAT